MNSFDSSVVSYPDRGHYGNSKYRGNTTGHIIVQFLETFHTDLTLFKEFIDCFWVLSIGTECSKPVDLC